MARGWESKSVEGQQEARERVPSGPREPAATDARRSLELARARMAALLDAARTDEQRRAIEEGIADLDARIAGLRPAGA